VQHDGFSLAWACLDTAYRLHVPGGHLTVATLRVRSAFFVIPAVSLASPRSGLDRAPLSTLDPWRPPGMRPNGRRDVDSAQPLAYGEDDPRSDLRARRRVLGGGAPTTPVGPSDADRASVSGPL